MDRYFHRVNGRPGRPVTVEQRWYAVAAATGQVMNVTVNALWGLEHASMGVSLLVVFGTLLTCTLLAGGSALLFGKPIDTDTDKESDEDPTDSPAPT